MRKTLLTVVMGLALLAPAAAVAAPSGTAQKSVTGFYRGRSVRYLDLGQVKLAGGNKVAPIWVFTNGADGQRNIVDVVPGQKGYTPLWQVVQVTWSDGATPRRLRSADEVRVALKAGEVSLRKTSTVVNCPVLGFRQKKVAGFYEGGGVQYLDLGQVKLAPGNKTAPIWAFTNGADGQQNIIDVVPGDKGYSPLWTVEKVTWADGVTPRVLRSADEVKAAVAAGEATIEKTPIVVNCPVV